MNEKMIEVFEKFKQRDDNCLWDLEVTPEGDQLRIRMETNEAYLRGRVGVMNVKLDRLIGLDEEDYIDKVFLNDYVSS